MTDITAETEDFSGLPGRTASAILSRLEHAIESGVYTDGDQLPAERQLAITFGTARSTIRKVLDQLEQRHLVIRRVGSGTFVSYSGPVRQGMDNIADLVSPLQLIETRFAIEPYMTRLATLHATGRDLDNIAIILDRLETTAGDQNLFSQYDTDFHLELARCSHNPLLVRIYQQVNLVRRQAQWDRMKSIILSPDKINAYNVQHRAIYDALRRRDVQDAVDQITRHLELARQDLIGAESA